MSAHDLRPFRLAVPESVLEDLRQRLARTRLPDEPPLAPWSTGTSVTFLKQLLDYWRDGFDWRAQEAKLNAFRQHTVPLAGIDVHFIHEEGKGPKPMPLLLSHGRPGSVFEFHKVLPMLTDPARFGGDPADAFTVVAPSLPGYVFSFKPGQKRFSLEQIAEVFAELMTGVLGYERFGAQGGDWGGFVCSRLGYAFPERLIGIHLNLLAIRRDPKMVADPTPEEKVFLDQLNHFLKEETGYQWIQGTKHDARIRLDGLAGRAGRVAGGEVPHLDRLRRQPRKRVDPRRDAHRHHAVLGHRRHRLVVLAVLCPHARAVAHSGRIDGRCPDRLRRVSQGDLAATALGGTAHVHEHPALDGDAQGRTLRGVGATGGPGTGGEGVFPAAAVTAYAESRLVTKLSCHSGAA